MNEKKVGIRERNITPILTCMVNTHAVDNTRITQHSTIQPAFRFVSFDVCTYQQYVAPPSICVGHLRFVVFRNSEWRVRSKARVDRSSHRCNNVY